MVEALVAKTLKALKDFNVNTLLLAGGVAANHSLRERLKNEASTNGFQVFIPPVVYCTDNAAMIARAGHERLMLGLTSPLSLSPEPRLTL